MMSAVMECEPSEVVHQLVDLVWSDEEFECTCRAIHSLHVLLHNRAELRMQRPLGVVGAVSNCKNCPEDFHMEAVRIVREGNVGVYRWHLLGRVSHLHIVSPGFQRPMQEISHRNSISVSTNTASLFGSLLIEEIYQTHSISVTDQMNWWT
jgi:hypothetical protein